MSNPTLSELMGRVLHHLYETTRHANAPVSLDIKQLAIDLGSTEPQVRKALEALKNSGHAEVRIYLNNQAAVCITADGELAVERAMTSTPSKATLKTTHVLAARRLGELRQMLDYFVDVPVQTEVDLEYFKEKSRSWIADVEHALEGIYEDDRVITECLRHLGLGIPSSKLEELRSALVPQGVNKKVYDHARALKYELKNTHKELEYLEGKLALLSAPTRPPTTEEKNAASQDAIERFNNANRRTPSPTPPKSTQSATAHSQSRTDMTPMQDSQQTRRDPKEVFVIYGRNANAVTELTRFLKATGLTVKTFDRHSAELGANPSVDDIVNRAVDSAKAVIVLVTPDEYIVLRPDLRAAHDKPHEYVRWGPRPNVICNRSPHWLG